MASRWCREAIDVFLMDDWAVDQFWLMVWDLSAAGFGLPGVVNLSELTELLALFDVVRPKAASSGATGGRVTSDLVSRLCFEAAALVYQGCPIVAWTWSRQQVVVAV